MNYPSEEESRKLFQKYNVSLEIIKHSEEVSNNSVVIGTQLLQKDNTLDITCLEVGGLLHDIGRWRYCKENGYYSPDKDFHEYETGRLLRELGYAEFADMLQRHPLGGLTPEETAILGFPEAVDLMPISLYTKIISIADKIRPSIGIYTLNQKIQDYRTNQRLHERYFNKMPGLLERTIGRVTSIWLELESLGMNMPPIK